MTVTSHYSERSTREPKHAEELGMDTLLRLARRFTGVILMFAAAGLWIAPGASWDGDLAFMKVGVFFFFALIGLTMFASGRAPKSQD
ncbi:hypothetical protein [Primorskyibacter sp. S187A]|uniref:hypothetical protein n=1 Tax=Primorskyibacter sp. S187A TaxID=3415130 RepID=UPI003C7B13A7